MRLTTGTLRKICRFFFGQALGNRRAASEKHSEYSELLMNTPAPMVPYCVSPAAMMTGQSLVESTILVTIA